MKNKQTVNVGDLSEIVNKLANAAPGDPRFALFEHLYDVHKWDGAAAFQWVDSMKDDPQGLTRCPKCDWKGEA